MNKGDIVPAEVTGIEEYGFFVKVADKYNGLIHISEIIEGYVNNIHDYVKVGETIYVHILDIDEEHNQMKLSIKNINYRINNSNNNVQESLRGFLPLHEKLDDWTNETLEEIKKNNN
ncbi:MAG: S1 RNA-binding domain-containing protein [Mollicutes bacterium]|nr:S1 RNA-binding domain-containing protein [Mollicutes bacterium]